MRVTFPISTRQFAVTVLFILFLFSCGKDTPAPIAPPVPHVVTASFGDDATIFHLDSTDFTRLFRVDGETQKYITVLSGDSVNIEPYDGVAIWVNVIPNNDDNKIIFHKADGDRVYAITMTGYVDIVLVRQYPA